MFSNLQNGSLFPISSLAIVANIGVALGCGLAIGWLYRHTYKGPGYSASFVNSLVLLAMITAVVILIIGNNLARAFGLVGAMGIIRFRTAVKETQDIVYIFFALVIGMASGAGYHRIAIIATIFVGLMIYVFAKMQLSSQRKDDVLLQFSYFPNGDGPPSYMPVFRKYCQRHKVINTRAVGTDREALELSFYVNLRDRETNSEFVRELRRTEGVSQINLYYDEDQF